MQRRLNDTGYHINSNMMAIKFKVLAESKDIHTGDPTVCTNKDCTAILSSLSTIKEEKEEGRKVSQLVLLLFFLGHIYDIRRGNRQC